MSKLDFKSLQNKYQNESKEFDKKLLQIPLEESGEEFLYLPKLSLDKGLRTIFKDPETAYLRKSIALSLIEAIKHFESLSFTVRVESAYRSLDEQKSRFSKRYASMKESFPDKSHEELLDMSNTYTAGISILAAHTAGAAVDITLLNSKGELLDFGVPYPHGDIESVTDYEDLPDKVKENRKILKEGMEKQGFTNYPFEYWHYSVGDVCATYLNGDKFAKYGPVNYDLKNDKIIILEDKTKFYTYFDLEDR